MGKSLYDLPFEMRIRQKYLLFGLVLGISMVGVLGIVGILGDIIMPSIMSKPINTAEIKAQFPYAMFVIMLPLVYWMWYSKQTPRKHPELNERVGLKDDWDRVSKI